MSGPLGIRKSILSGRVNDAITMLEEHFPSVLHVNIEEVNQSQTEHFSATTHSNVTQTSTEPAHVLLNLHIQDFIESARTNPLPYYCTDCDCYPSRSQSASYVVRDGRGVYGSMRSKGRPALLSKARGLFMEARRILKPADRMVYLGELARTTAIISYAHPEETDLAPYFAQHRREVVADQVERDRKSVV